MGNKKGKPIVAVVGRPNVGKSTLFNSLAGEKIAIVKDTPGITRDRIYADITWLNQSFTLIDTGGIEPDSKDVILSQMREQAQIAIDTADVILFMVDVKQGLVDADMKVADMLRKSRKPIILVVNKVDQINKQQVLPVISRYSDKLNFVGAIPISAKEKTNLDQLVEEIKKYLEEGPQYYPSDMITDQPERLVIGELIREKALHLTKEEIPHAIAVDIEEISKRNNDDLYIRATIYVERESQKGIVIGAKGSLLKEIGQLARADIENLLGSKVYIDLWVKVKKDWRNRDGILRGFGYE